MGKFEIAKSWRGSSPSPLCSQLVRTKRAGAAHCSTVPQFHSLSLVSTQLHSSQSEIQFSRQPRPSSPFPITNTLMLQPSGKYKKASMFVHCTSYNLDECMQRADLRSPHARINCSLFSLKILFTNTTMCLRCKQYYFLPQTSFKTLIVTTILDEF